MKEKVIKEIDKRQGELIALSHRIHSNPELGFSEFMAADWLIEFLAGDGFSIEKGIVGLETAFLASYGSGKPVVAFLAEYDALPDIGHACGHNIIAAASVGAGLALKAVLRDNSGTVQVIGTPAEEVNGGKAIMVDKGVFDGIDAVMLVHPDSRNCVTTMALACHGLDVEFFGKPAHAAARPEEGINALEALILAFNNINSLRQHVRNSSRIHGIITDGGKAPNVVPEHSAGRFLVRALEEDYLEELKERVLNCFISASVATGTKLEYRWSQVRYATMKNNLPLAELFASNLKQLDREVQPFDRQMGMGSTDMGNVSQRVPAIHPFIAVVTPEISVHTPEFARAAISDKGDRGLLDAAKAMAMTGVDLLCDPAAIERVKKAF